MRNPKYKIVNVNTFWAFHVYKRVWGVWVRILGTDQIERAEAVIRGAVKKPRLFDCYGVEINEPGDQR